MKTKNKIPHLILAGLFGVSTAHAATIAFGDSIFVDFGPTASTGNENTISSSLLSIADAIRFSDGAATGVGIAVTKTGSNWTQAGTIAGTGLYALNTLNTTDAEVYGDALGINNGSGATMSITFTGLSDSLTYDLTGGVSHATAAAKYATGWTIAGQAAPTYQVSDATAGNGYISFDGLTSSANTLTITLDREQINHLAVSQLQLTAVPEPSSTALLGLGGLAFALRRRRA
jgi:hypothetical protein